MKSKILKFIIFSSLFASYIGAAEILVFSKAYELALLNANAIKSSAYQAEAAKEKVNQEYSKLYPQINFSTNYTKSDYEYNPNYSRISHVRQGLFDYTLSLRQSIYNADIYSRIAMETSRSKLYEINSDLKKEELAQSVFKVYLNVLKSHNKIKLYESYIEYNKSKLDILTQQYEMHLANKMDLLQMRVEYSSMVIGLNKEKKLLKVNELKLTQLIGDVEYALPTLESSKKTLDGIEVMKGSIVSSDDFEKNLKVLQAQVSLQLSKEQITNASDAHLPRLDLQASASKYNTDNPTSSTPYNNVQQAMLVLNIPIFSGGLVSSMVASSELMNKAANEDLINAKKEVQVQYDEYKANFDSSIESVSMYKNALESAELYVNAIEQGYDHGLKSIIDLNDAKTKLYDVKYKYIENIYELVDSYIGLLIVTNNFENIGLLDKIVE
ncbi:MAG: TolC family protein [Sulfurimonas sp.]|jgi:outer membrane protein